MTFTATKFRRNLYRILEQVAKSGEAVEVVHRGKVLRLVPEVTLVKNKFDRLIRRPDGIVGNPSDLIHLDWSSEWRP